MKYFTITELCKSDVAESKHLQNIPTAKQEQALVSLINNTIDHARESLGFPVHGDFWQNTPSFTIKAVTDCIISSASFDCDKYL